MARLGLVLVLVLACGVAASAATGATIDEHPLPRRGSGPRSIVNGPT
jgi:hypothetical protein